MAWHAILQSLDNNAINLIYDAGDGRTVTQVYPFGSFTNKADLVSKITSDLAELNQTDNRKATIFNALSAQIGTQLI